MTGHLAGRGIKTTNAREGTRVWHLRFNAVERTLPHGDVPHNHCSRVDIDLRAIHGNDVEHERWMCNAGYAMSFV